MNQATLKKNANKMRTRWLGILGLALMLLLALLYGGVSVVAAIQLTKPKQRVQVNANVFSAALPYQRVGFSARNDGWKLSAWYRSFPSTTEAIVLVHGKDQNAEVEFDGRFIQLADGLNQAGFAVLPIDLRGHGKSQAAHLTFGAYEQRDVLGAVDWLLREKGFAPGHIGVLGVSMGAASSIYATAQEPAIGALVADSSYAEISSVVQAGWKPSSHLPDWLLPSTKLFVGWIYHYNMDDVRPVDNIAQISPRPVLITHGEADRLVPVQHAYQLKKAYPSAEFWVVPGVDHARAYMHDPQAYQEKVTRFFKQNLSKK